MGKSAILGELEEILLLAISRLAENAYGVTIRETVRDCTGRDLSYGAISVTLERLEEKGFVTSHMGGATPERGGRAKRFFRIEGAGLQALDRAEAARNQLRQRLQPGLQN